MDVTIFHYISLDRKDAKLLYRHNLIKSSRYSSVGSVTFTVIPVVEFQ